MRREGRRRKLVGVAQSRGGEDRKNGRVESDRRNGSSVVVGDTERGKKQISRAWKANVEHKNGFVDCNYETMSLNHCRIVGSTKRGDAECDGTRKGWGKGGERRLHCGR